VSDALAAAVRPMAATVNGRILLLSTPAGRRGHFFETWTGGDPSWERITARADACPRISAAFLASERTALGKHLYEQEYENVFHAAEQSAFDWEAVEAAVSADVAPLWPSAPREPVPGRPRLRLPVG
jgi:hypothetical protein